jgi:DNA-binding NarL/FixJ family response regulator
MTQPIRVLIVDDQALFREGLHTLLSVQAGIEVVGEANNGEEALHLVAQTSPDVVLMDMRMPVMSGITATRRIKVEFPHVRVIALTTFDDDEYVFEGLRAGASGYLLKDVSIQKLVEAIQAAVHGGGVLEPSIALKVIEAVARQAQVNPDQQPLIEPLTFRELDVLRLMTEGMSNKEIAEKLVVTEGTVKNHVSNIISKLSVRDRTQAALRAKELRLV